MSERGIKTALEIALEKSQQIQVSDQSVHEYEVRKKAQEAVGRFLKSGENKLAQELKNTPERDVTLMREEMIASLLNNIQLPKSGDRENSFSLYWAGIAGLKSHSIASIEAKFHQLFEQYSIQKSDIEKRLKQQLAQSFNQLEERMGSRMRMNPETNPEFAKQKAEVMRRFNAQYEGALERLKDEARNSI